LQASVTETTTDMGGSTSSKLVALTTELLSKPSSGTANTIQTTVEIAQNTTELPTTASGPVSSITFDYTKIGYNSTV